LLPYIAVKKEVCFESNVDLLRRVSENLLQKLSAFSRMGTLAFQKALAKQCFSEKIVDSAEKALQVLRDNSKQIPKQVTPEQEWVRVAKFERSSLRNTLPVWDLFPSESKKTQQHAKSAELQTNLIGREGPNFPNPCRWNLSPRYSYPVLFFCITYIPKESIFVCERLTDTCVLSSPPGYIFISQHSKSQRNERESN